MSQDEFVLLLILANKTLSSAITRYFRRNEGTTDGGETGLRLIPDPLTHFDVEFELLGDIDSSGTFVAQSTNTSSTLREFQIYQSGAPAGVIVGGGITSMTTTLTRGVWRFMFDGVDITLMKNGVIVETISASIGTVIEPAATFTTLMRHAGSNSSYDFHYSGVQANVKIRNTLGAIIHNWPISSNTATEADLVSGSVMTFVNGNADDWGLFDRQADGDWKGNGLIVPPWDSVDQVLVTA